MATNVRNIVRTKFDKVLLAKIILTSTLLHVILTALYIAAVVILAIHGLVFPSIVFAIVTLLSLYNLGYTLRRREHASECSLSTVNE